MAIKTRAFQSADFADSLNRIGRPVRSNAVYVPDQIEADGDRLTWVIPPVSHKANWVVPGNRIISSFVKLASATSTGPFVKFARRYGVFGAVELRRDAPRQGDNELLFRGERWLVSADYTCAPYPQWEPIQLWGSISQAALSMLRIAAQLNARPPRLGDLEDWRVLFPGSGIDFEGCTDRIGDAQWLLYTRVNDWLKVGRVGLRMEPEPQSWAKRRPLWQTEIHYGGAYNLYGALAAQLMLVIAGAHALYTCSGCRFPYIRDRRPKAGQNNYCDDCGPERSAQDRDRRRKDKMISARRLAAEGMPRKEIARKLSTKTKSVRLWVGDRHRRS